MSKKNKGYRVIAPPSEEIIDKVQDNDTITNEVEKHPNNIDLNNKAQEDNNLNKSRFLSWLSHPRGRKLSFIFFNIPLLAFYATGLHTIGSSVKSSLLEAQSAGESTTLIYLAAIVASMIFIVPVAIAMFYLLRLVYHRTLDGFVLGVTFISELYFVYAFFILPFRTLPDPSTIKETPNFIVKGVLYKVLVTTIAFVVALI